MSIPKAVKLGKQDAFKGDIVCFHINNRDPNSRMITGELVWDKHEWCFYVKKLGAKELYYIDSSYSGHVVLRNPNQ